ncbi:MAG: shikimate kinase [Pseudomonadota bacterium]
MANSLIHIVGPGAAGKTATGEMLASALGQDFIDLDQEYLQRADIASDIEQHGYDGYVYRNVTLYLEILERLAGDAVMATSSGFMTYEAWQHPMIRDIQSKIASAHNTVLILPSFDRSRCIEETIRRQLSRAYTSDDAEVHRTVIEQRFDRYRSLGRIRVASDQPVCHVVADIVDAMGRSHAL